MLSALLDVISITQAKTGYSVLRIYAIPYKVWYSLKQYNPI